ncbi:MAG: AraC family transcriptional regulator [Pseudomonadota bacterium]
MDLISDVLGQVQISGREICNYRLSGDWRVPSPAVEEAQFYLVSKGAVVVTFDDEHHELHAGDMIFFPHGHDHIFGSHKNAPLTTLDTLYERTSVTLAGEGRVRNLFSRETEEPQTWFIYGQFNLSGPSFARLPRFIIMRNKGDSPSLCLDSMIRQISNEVISQQPGALAALDTLLSMLFIQGIRDWLARTPDHDLAWIPGLSDKHISHAVQLLHDNVAHPWTVKELAGNVGMSRSSFASRFTQVMGEPPLKYLTRWRMVVARQTLENSPNCTISYVAMSVGYDSEASFSVAFKRHFGKPPGGWRKVDAMVAA